MTLQPIVTSSITHFGTKTTVLPKAGAHDEHQGAAHGKINARIIEAKQGDKHRHEYHTERGAHHCRSHDVGRMHRSEVNRVIERGKRVHEIGSEQDR